LKHDLYALHDAIEDRHWWFTGRREIIGAVLEAVFPISGTATVIDVGCGTGGNLAYFARRYQTIGMDSSPLAAEKARIRSPRSMVIVGDSAEALDGCPLKGRTAWLFLDVLEHLHDDGDFFSRFAFKMRCNDIVMLAVPAGPHLWSPHDMAFGHVRRYTKKRLEQVWEELPFSVLLCSFFNSRLYPLVRVIRWLKCKKRNAADHTQTDFHIHIPFVNTILYNIFKGESKRLVPCLTGARGYKRGVSLMAVLKKCADPVGQ